MAHLLVVGGANMDIKGMPAGPLIPGLSNPGRISLSPGGVARNVAENLARLGHAVRLVTAVGEDPFADFLLAATREGGVDISGIFRLPGVQTGMYLAIIGEGRVQAAVSAVEAVEALRPEHLWMRSEWFQDAEAVIADANLLPETLAEVDRLSKGKSLILLPVSPAKAGRLSHILAHATLLVGSAKEAAALAGTLADSPNDLIAAGKAILALGPQVVAITIGEQGAVLITEDQELWASPLPATVVDPTGAGDAFAAGIIDGLVRGFPLPDALKVAMRRAALTLGTLRSTPMNAGGRNGGG